THRRWTIDDGRWTMDDGRWTMDHGPWTMDDGPWTLSHGPDDPPHRRLQILRSQARARGIHARRRRGRDDGHHRLFRHRKVRRHQAHRRTARARFWTGRRRRPRGAEALAA